MSVFAEIAEDYAAADAALAQVEQQAFETDDEGAFDRAVGRRKRNDQAYFLYLFTRFEAEVNSAAGKLLDARVHSGQPWADRRIWQAWSRGKIQDIALLSKVEVLIDKSRTDYALVKSYYDGRNMIAHGGTWEERFAILTVASTMERMQQSFETE